MSGIQQRVVLNEMKMIEAYVFHQATRVINRTISSQKSSETIPYAFPAWTEILVFFKISAQNQPNQCIRATVIDTAEKKVIYIRSNKEALMRVAYGDLRVLPMNDLAR